MKILKKTFAIRKAFDYISAPRQTELVCRDTVKCPSGLRSTPGKCVYKKLYREFESLLHRHIKYLKAPFIGAFLHSVVSISSLIFCVV